MSSYFGGYVLPEKASSHHFLIVGKSGSGKTLTLRMLMGTALPAVLRLPDQRAVVFDVKQDMLAILAGMGIPDDSVVILNPYDKRCSAWDMAADITAPETALQLATILIPQEESSNNRYFSDAARDLLWGVIEVFNTTAPLRWNFADLLYAMRHPDRLRHVLSQTLEGEELIALHLNAGNTSRSVLGTARAFLAPFGVIAATWSHAWHSGRKVSLRAFLTQNQILVLGNNQAAISAIQAINRVLFQRLTELILDQTESETRRCWFFLDEVRKLGKLEGLDDLMIAGRSKGSCVVLGFQAIEGMRAVYGPDIAEEIVSMCGSIGVLKVSGVATPRWASEIFGEQEVREETRSVSEATTAGPSASQTITETTNETIRERRMYLPSEFHLIPLPERGKSLFGYFRSEFRLSKPYYAEIPPTEVARRLHPLDLDRSNFEPWPDNSAKYLPSWESADYERLGIPPVPPSPPSSGAGDPGGPNDPGDPGAFRDPNAS